MTVLIASDLHLEDQRPDITRAFFHLLDQNAGQIDQLYLLGDIFEVWLGDDTPSACADALALKLNALAKQGIRIFLMHGNRDFLIGETYAQRCGAQLVAEPCLISIADQQALLMHGDSLCTRDTDYMRFRALVRNPNWIADFLAKPLSERIDIGRALREQSQQSATQKQVEIMDVTSAEVVSVMNQHGVKLMIHGHTHRPAVHTVETATGLATRVVLGDWYKQGWYVLADSNGFSLKAFPFTD